MKLTGILLVLLALVIGVAPHYTDCQSQGRALTLENGTRAPMKCHWSGVSEIALAAPIGSLGLLTALLKRKDTRRALGLIGLVLGGFVISLPTWLIGVCANPEMICNQVMRPLLILSGVLVMGVSAAVIWLARAPDPAAAHLTTPA